MRRITAPGWSARLPYHTHTAHHAGTSRPNPYTRATRRHWCNPTACWSPATAHQNAPRRTQIFHVRLTGYAHNLLLHPFQLLGQLLCRDRGHIRMIPGMVADNMAFRRHPLQQIFLRLHVVSGHEKVAGTFFSLSVSRIREVYPFSYPLSNVR